jgi:hypothetical protein
MSVTYAIRFDFPEGKAFAGMYKDAAGFAPTIATAELFNDADLARRWLENSYGDGTRPWGKVVIVVDQ